MELGIAAAEDFDRIKDFYRYVCENTPNISEHGRWLYGSHPTDETLRAYVDAGYLYYVEEDGEVLAAVVVTPFQGDEEDYHAVPWTIEATDDEVSVVHLLGVSPRVQGRGLAKQMMKEVIEDARHCGKRAVRLDTLRCNVPARKLYESLGFTRCGVQNWSAKHIGRIDFCLYELPLGE